MAAPATTFTKVFDFSASHASGVRVQGYNYRLHLSFKGAPDERAVIEAVEHGLIQKVHSRDLGLDVDFLKGEALEGAGLARAFWKQLEACAPARLKSLTLERDARTRWTLEAL